MVKFVAEESMLAQASEVLSTQLQQAVDVLHTKTGKGCEFLGWLDFPQNVDNQYISDVKQIAQQIVSQSQVVVLIGIGGSYLGARALIEALCPNFSHPEPEIVYAGHHLSDKYLQKLYNILAKKDYSLVVVSKSGSTIETAATFGLLQRHCIDKYGLTEAKKRIVCITDQKEGILRAIVNKNAYSSLAIPADIGGRYSILTAVGLLPAAVAGLNIEQLMNGAKNMCSQILSSPKNVATQYAMCRTYLQSIGYNIEVLATFEPSLFYFAEWWKQLFAESEGKNHKGIFPTSMIYTTDLHSLGQYMQQGQRIMFETFLTIQHFSNNCKIKEEDLLDKQFNSLKNKSIGEINHLAQKATMKAHKRGNVPIIELNINDLSEYSLGELFYFFEYACAVSAYMQQINPFDQPGVAEYKKELTTLLSQ